jgi:hypothetical protein
MRAKRACTNPPSRGLGDTVEKLIKRGFWLFGQKPKACGRCRKRQQWLNKQVPYRSPKPPIEPRAYEHGKEANRREDGEEDDQADPHAVDDRSE